MLSMLLFEDFLGLYFYTSHKGDRSFIILMPSKLPLKLVTEKPVMYDTSTAGLWKVGDNHPPISAAFTDEF